MSKLQGVVPCILTGIGGALAGHFGAISQPQATDAASNARRDPSTQRGDAPASGGRSGRTSGSGTAEHSKGRLALAMKGALGHALETKRLQRWMLLLESMGPEDAELLLERIQEPAVREMIRLE
jgi:hypothetical protein